MEVTPYTDVTNTEVNMAQFVIEVYTGRVEGEVDGARDKAMLARAVTAQTVYMRENPAITFEQVGATSMSRGEVSTSFDIELDSPFIAPLAVMACRHLSWRNSRSVKIGRIFQKATGIDWSHD